MNPSRILKLLWAAPCTAVGLPLAALALATGGRIARKGHTLEAAFDDRRSAARRIIRRLPFNGIALGHVIVATSPRELERLRDHERVHVAQAERWGPFFIPAYLAASALAWLRRRDPYWDNRFEEEARRLAATAGSRRSGAGTPPPPS